jgi:hypothetical protein
MTEPTVRRAGEISTPPSAEFPQGFAQALAILNTEQKTGALKNE